MKKINELILDKRKELGENQEQFAKRFGFSRVAVSDLERGITTHIPVKLIEIIMEDIFNDGFKQGFNSCKTMVELGEHSHCCVIPGKYKSS